MHKKYESNQNDLSILSLFDKRFIIYIFAQDNFSIFKNLHIELDLNDLKKYYNDYQEEEFFLNLSNTLMKLYSYTAKQSLPTKSFWGGTLRIIFNIFVDETEIGLAYLKPNDISKYIKQDSKLKIILAKEFINHILCIYCKYKYSDFDDYSNIMSSIVTLQLNRFCRIAEDNPKRRLIQAISMKHSNLHLLRVETK